MVPRVQAVVAVIAGERERFASFCRALSDEELSRPVPGSTWVVKDFISHLATIDTPVARWFTTIVTEGPARGGGDGTAWDVDRFNDAAVAARRSHTVDDILAEAAQRRAALIRTLENVTDEQLDRNIHFGGDSKRPPAEIPFARYLRGWARHDVIHVADMLRALPQRRTDPVIGGWLEEPDVVAIVRTYEQAMA